MEKIVPWNVQKGFFHPNLTLMIYSSVTILFEKGPFIMI